MLITSDVAGRFQEWSRKGVRFVSAPRLRRIKYDPAHAPPPRRARLLGEEAPVWGGVFARFRDLDGNTFSLVSFDEVTHAVEAERRAAAEKREAERRAAHELAIARQVQSRLFPQSLPALRSLDYAGACLPARAVGGDYYDFLSLGPDRLGLVIGDVMGKGIAAALLMANLQANLRSQVGVRPRRAAAPAAVREPALLRQLARGRVRQPLLRRLPRRHGRPPLRELRPPRALSSSAGTGPSSAWPRPRPCSGSSVSGSARWARAGSSPATSWPSTPTA